MNAPPSERLLSEKISSKHGVRCSTPARCFWIRSSSSPPAGSFTLHYAGSIQGSPRGDHVSPTTELTLQFVKINETEITRNRDPFPLFALPEPSPMFLNPLYHDSKLIQFILGRTVFRSVLPRWATKRTEFNYAPQNPRQKQRNIRHSTTV